MIYYPLGLAETGRPQKGDPMDDIREEGAVEEPQDGDQFARLLAESAATPQRFQPGERVEARVVSITGDQIFVDAGGKGEGMIDRKELEDEGGTLRTSVGANLTAFFVSSDQDGTRFTTRLGSQQPPAAKSFLQEAFDNRIPVEGSVAREVKGGFEVRIAGGVRAFCPFSQMDLRRVQQPAEWVGKALTFRMTEYDWTGRNIILSRRVILEEERQAVRGKLRDTLREGDLVEGEVTSLADFGAFVDIGGMEGLIPASELSWKRVGSVASVLAAGQRVKALVKSLDWKRDRITLSLRDTQPDPWGEVERKYPAGTTHPGKVTRLAAFGAFVALEEGVEGLLHISKLGEGKRLKHPKEAVQPGQTLEVKVEKVDVGERRITLGLSDERAAAAEAQALEEYRRRAPAPVAPPPSGGSIGTLGDLLRAKMAEKRKE